MQSAAKIGIQSVMSLWLLAVGSGTAAAQATTTALTQKTAATDKLFLKVLPSTFWVGASVKREDGAQELRIRSGALVDKDHRLVVTVYNTIPEGDSKVTVAFPKFDGGKLVNESSAYETDINQGKGIAARVLFREAARDLTVLQLDELPEGAAAIPLAKASAKPRQMLLGVSAVFNNREMWTYRPEFVASVAARKWRDDSTDQSLGIAPYERKARAVETQVFFTTMQAGGPLVNERGELVGISTYAPAGIGGAAPAAAPGLAIDLQEVKAILKHKDVLAALKGE